MAARRRGQRGCTPICSNAEWRRQLTTKQYRVARRHVTERAFTGDFWNCLRADACCCVCRGTALFRLDTTFDSGTGWPRFSAPLPDAPVGTREDRRPFMRRTEVHCSRGEAHP